MFSRFLKLIKVFVGVFSMKVKYFSKEACDNIRKLDFKMQLGIRKFKAHMLFSISNDVVPNSSLN